MVILGAGISGLTAAYELGRKGYEVMILEALHQRRRPQQHAAPWRPHRRDRRPAHLRFRRRPRPVLQCRPGTTARPPHHGAELPQASWAGAPLAPFINDNRNAWYQDDAINGGKRLRNGEFITDTRGFVAELAAKCLSPMALDAPLTHGDYENILDYLRQFGDLDAQFKYKGSLRVGVATHDHSGPLGMKKPMASPSELFRSRIAEIMSFGEGDDQAAMMMEPVGGMDGIVKGFLRKVGNLVHLHCVVREDRAAGQRARAWITSRRARTRPSPPTTC